MRFCALFLLFFHSLIGQGLLAQQPPPTFRIKADFIKVPVTVFDHKGKLINTLTRDDFRLLDEGRERPIENFVLDKAPVHVVLLLDVSGSVREEIKEIKQAAIRFASAFESEDRIAIISFADKIEVLQPWTNRQKRIRKSLKKLKPGYRTALWDALMQTSSKMLEQASGRKVIILLTDGLDNESYANYDDVIENLVSSGISLYIVSRTRLVLPKVAESSRVRFLNRVMKQVLKEDKNFVDVYFREKETSMNHLAESTGGRVFFPERLVELRSSYAQVARELKNQYVLTFAPPSASDKRFRRIEVICSEATGRIFHRLQYSWQPGQ
ncbi:MAG: VWA domain-containing protein [Acidobacteriota bacterium]